MIAGDLMLESPTVQNIEERSLDQGYIGRKGNTHPYTCR
jgi:hypothetical protein